MKKLLDQYKNAIVMVAICFASFLALKAIYQDYIARKAKVKIDQEQIAQRKDIAQRAEITVSEYEKSRKFFRFKNIESFKEVVEASCQKTGVAIDYLQQSQNDRGAYWEAMVNLGTQSPYKNIHELINTIEADNVMVERIYIRASALDKKMQTELIMKAFVLKK